MSIVSGSPITSSGAYPNTDSTDSLANWIVLDASTVSMASVALSTMVWRWALVSAASRSARRAVVAWTIRLARRSYCSVPPRFWR